LAHRIRLIRNHGETSLEDSGVTDLTNMWGFNYRLTEIQAAIGITQLRRLPMYINERVKNCDYLNQELQKFPGITTPITKEGCNHVYYAHTLKFNEKIVGIHRNKFVEALSLELPSAYLRESTGKLIGSGYTRPLYMQPIYQLKQGTKCSFNCNHYDGSVNYSKGICPVTERMYEKELITHEYMRPPMTKADLDDFLNAFDKVYSLKDTIK